MAVTYSTDDVDEARSIGRDVFFDHQLEPVRPATGFRLTLSAVQYDLLTAGVFSLGCETSISIAASTPRYSVGVQLGGALDARVGKHNVVVDATKALVTTPSVGTATRGWSNPSERSFVVKFDPSALETELSRILATDVSGPIDFPPELDVGRGLGAEWFALTSSILTGLDSPNPFGLHPFVVAPLTSAVMAGFLLATDHQYSDRLWAGSRPIRAPVFRQAVDFIHEHAAEPITPTQVAAHVGVTLRALRLAFLAETAASPYDYIRHVRLERVHEELLTGSPDTTSVGHVALRWGFVDDQQFVNRYHGRFGETPSRTLAR